MNLTMNIDKDLNNKISDNINKINVIRNDLFKMRFLKARKEGFSSSKYRQKRKDLARLLTIENIKRK